MIWQVTHITKALTLLAVMLLPVQHSLAATCCCRGGHQDVNMTATDSVADCCSRIGLNCCSGTSGHAVTCCDESSSGAKSKPCKCPGGCVSDTVPSAISYSSTGSSLEDDTSGGIPERTSTLIAEGPGQTPLVYQLGALASCPSNGPARCARLCRFRF